MSRLVARVPLPALGLPVRAVAAALATFTALVMTSLVIVEPASASLSAPASHNAAPGPASLVVSRVTTEPGLVHLLVTPTNVPLNSTVDPKSITVTLENQPLTAQAGAATDLTGAPTRIVAVVLDLNGQSTSGYVSAARSAADALAASLPADVQLGLFVVNNVAVQALAPTLDRGAFTSAVGAAKVEGNKDPVDVVESARAALAGVSAAIERRLIVISNGRSANTSTYDTAVGQRVAGSGVGLDMITLGASSGTGLTGLRMIADAAGGRLLTANNSEELTNLVRGCGAVMRPTLMVTATVPAAVAGTAGALTVSAPGFVSTLTTVTFAALAGAAAPAAQSLSWVPGGLVYLVGACLFGALLAFVLAFAWPRPANYARLKQIDQYGPSRVIQTSRALAAGTAAALPRGGDTPGADGTTGATSAETRLSRPALAAAASVARIGGLDVRIGRNLERSGIRMRAHEWLLVQASAVVGGAVFFGLLFGFFGIVFGAVVGLLGTLSYQSVRANRRARAFSDQLPDGLQLVIGSLRAGFSLSQALESLVRESPEPLAAEFGRVVAEHRLGADLSDALDRLAKRTESEDLGWAVMAVRIQRDVGGNLAEVLQTSVDTMRERERLRRHVRSLSAEGRLSAWVLIVMPLVLALFMIIYRRGYISPLFTDIRGIGMLVVGTVLFVVGIAWMTRIVKVAP